MSADPDAAEYAARQEAWRIWDDAESGNLGTPPSVISHESFDAGWDCASAYFDAKAHEATARERERIRRLAIDQAARQEANGTYYTTREVLLGFADLLDGGS